MSSVSMSVEIGFPEQKVADLFYLFLSGYDHSSAKQNDFEKEKKLLSALKLDGDSLFDAGRCDVDISAVHKLDNGHIRFELEGGVNTGYGFWERLRKLFLAKNPDQLLAVILNDQVYEYELQVYDAGVLKYYATGENQVLDEELQRRLGEEDYISVLRELHANDSLPLKEVTESDTDLNDLVNGLEIMQDQKKQDILLASFFIKGVALFLMSFLVGWLVLGYLWTSLACGLIIGFAFYVKRAMLLKKARGVYDEEKNGMVEEFRKMGMSEEEAKKMVDTFETSMTGVMKGIAKSEK